MASDDLSASEIVRLHTGPHEINKTNRELVKLCGIWQTKVGILQTETERLGSDFDVANVKIGELQGDLGGARAELAKAATRGKNLNETIVQQNLSLNELNKQIRERNREIQRLKTENS